MFAETERRGYVMHHEPVRGLLKSFNSEIKPKEAK